MPSLASVPDEILEHIAVFAATHPFLGPPAALPALLSLNRHAYAALAPRHNPHLAARIFAGKFDLAAARRRLGVDALSAHAIADELVQRCIVLKHLRALAGSRVRLDATDAGSSEDERMLDALLWTTFLMVLEDDGRNTSQLREYARVDEWLKTYWFANEGASRAVHMLESDLWPPSVYVANLALFRKAEKILKLVVLNAPTYPLTHLLWTSFQPGQSHIHFGGPNTRSDEPFHVGPTTLVEQASSFTSTLSASKFAMRYFGQSLFPYVRAPPPAAVPAILSYLALAASQRADDNDIFGHLPGITFYGRFASGGGGTPKERQEEAFVAFSGGRRSARWECDWMRCVYSLAEDGNGNGHGNGRDEGEGQESLVSPVLACMYRPGSLNGFWEGSFTYTEFQSFAALLSGVPPSRLQDCIIAQHNQTWRIREHHLLGPPSSSSSSSSSVTQSSTNLKVLEPGSAESPLPPGDPIFAYIPDGASVAETPAGLTISLPSSSSSGSLQPTRYDYTCYTPERARALEAEISAVTGQSEGGRHGYAERVRDVILTGEGHSGWGEFRLLGRVRPSDGFFSVLKEYTGGDRGRWLYRGYLVGDGGGDSYTGDRSDFRVGDGYIAGRWRDTLTTDGNARI
ncbi:hypothetical protein DFH11DRAFT_1590149 [Phellopilus nigrolimitatus]|nr:hypothetical protein DFH11DRAFT_1590149 [Phellopilus nigrolimitatus]